jgi:hypothetical protein
MSCDQIQEEIEERKAFEEKYHVPPNLHFESECAYTEKSYPRFFHQTYHLVNNQ